MRRFCCFIFIILISVEALFAQTPDWSFVDYAYNVYGADSELYDKEQITPRDMIAISLSFSLVKPGTEEWNKSFEKYDSLLGQVKKAQEKCSTEKELAEEILNILYADCLVKYGKHKDFMNNTLLRGEYNCVSSSVLYEALAIECGIDARAQIVPGHIFVSVYIDGKRIDVETTNSAGFEPGTKKVKYVNGRKYESVCKPKNYSKRTEVSPLMASTRLAINNASLMNDDNELELAIPMAEAVLRLLKDSSEGQATRFDFDKLLGNYALKVAGISGSDDACLFLEYAIDKYGKTKYLLAEYADHAYNSMVDDYNASNFDLAMNKLFMRKKYLSEKDYSTNCGFIEKGQVYDIHNKMVALYNKGQKEEAVELIEKGLQRFPGNKILSDDLRLLKK